MDRSARARLRDRLPPGVMAKDVALERVVWNAIVRRVDAEVRHFLAGGLEQRAAKWHTDMAAATNARAAVLQQRREVWRARLDAAENRSIADFSSGERLLSMLGATRWRVRDAVIEIDDD